MSLQRLLRRPRRLCVGAALLLAGCSGAINTSDSVLGEDLPDLRGTLPTALPAPDAPSLTNDHDRSHWGQPTATGVEPVRIVVEERQTMAFPNYVSTPLYEHSTARARGEWPTATTALELGGDPGMMAIEGVAAPVWSAFDLLVSPIRMVQQPPWVVVRIPSTPPLEATTHPAAAANETRTPAAAAPTQ